MTSIPIWQRGNPGSQRLALCPYSQGSREWSLSQSPHRVLGSPVVALGVEACSSVSRLRGLSSPWSKVSLLRQTPGHWSGQRAGAPSPPLMAAPLILPPLLEEEETHWPQRVGPRHSMATTRDPCPPPTSSGDRGPLGGLHPPLPQPWKHEAGRVCVGLGTH